MRERKVVITWEAIYDVTGIADYIEQEFGRERADRFERDIRQKIKDISFWVVSLAILIFITVPILFSRSLFRRPLSFMW